MVTQIDLTFCLCFCHHVEKLKTLTPPSKDVELRYGEQKRVVTGYFLNQTKKIVSQKPGRLEMGHFATHSFSPYLLIANRVHLIGSIFSLL